MINLPKIYLASQSARRQQLLQQIGVPYELITINIDESIKAKESPEAYVTRMATEKAHAALLALNDKAKYPILTADTIVTINQQILDKPQTKVDYLTGLHQLSNNTHQVMTAIGLTCQGKITTKLCTTQVKFREISTEEMNYYWEHYHPIDKAGGYGIQDFASVFVEWIRGSYSNVVGLPLTETYQLLT